jgi:hypothetical protein
LLQRISFPIDSIHSFAYEDADSGQLLSGVPIFASGRIAMIVSLNLHNRKLSWLAALLLAILPAAGCKTPAERREEKMEAAARARAEAHQRAIADIVELVHNHTSDTVIINLIHSNHVNYALTADDIVYLKSQGADDAVVTAMQATSARVPRPGVIVNGPPPPPPPVYVEPGPVVVGVGSGWRR